MSDYYDVNTKPEQTKPKKNSVTKQDDNKKRNNIISSKEEFNIKIKELFQKKDLNLLDAYLIDFLKDNTIARLEKIDILWNLVKQSDLNPEQEIYILDYLETLQPIEIADDMIAMFDGNLDIQTKIRIMNILRSCLFIANPEKQSQEQLDYIATQSEAIQNFFTSQIQHPRDAELFKHAIMPYPSVASSEEAASVITKLFSDYINKSQNSSKDQNQDEEILAPSDIASLTIQVAFSTREAQSDFLPEFFVQFQDMPKEQRQLFNEVLYTAVSNSAVELNDTIIPQIQDYIKKQETEVSVDKEITYNDLSSYYNWVDAYSSIMNNDKTKKNEFIANIVMNSENPIKQATILVFSETENTISFLDNDKISELKTDFDNSLKNENINGDGRLIIENALQKIEELQSSSEKKDT